MVIGLGCLDESHDFSLLYFHLLTQLATRKNHILDSFYHRLFVQVQVGCPYFRVKKVAGIWRFRFLPEIKFGGR
jgi:hypothetical protein